MARRVLPVQPLNKCRTRGSSSSDGANVQQWTCNVGANQKWRIEDQGDDTSRLVNVASGKVLDTADCSTADCSTVDGADVRQWSWLNNTCQQWKLNPS
jgi:hypothetical protein